jgi:hypothetical protein
MSIGCKKLRDHMIEHELIDLITEVSGQVPSDLAVYDDDVLVQSGVQHLNFEDEISAIYDGVTGRVDISLENMRVDDGRLWVYDITRSKWLSSDRLNASGGRKGRIKNGYLRILDGQSCNLTGYRLPRNGTITAIAAQTRDNETWTLRVRKNGDPTDIASLALNNVAGGHDTTVDVDVSEGDLIQLFAETTTFFGIKDPFVWVEIAWRE